MILRLPQSIQALVIPALVAVKLSLFHLATVRAATWTMPTPPQQKSVVQVQDGDLITDDGGPSNPYSSLYRAALTLVPPAGQVVMLEFLAFDLEQDFDNLVVFDGPATSYPALLCQTSGNTLPPSITGSHPAGLTLFLSSDGSVEGSGFVARVRLMPAPVPPNTPQRTNITLLGHDTLRICNGIIFDHGGPTCNYLHNTGYILDSNGLPIPDGFTTLIPDLPGHVIQLDFLRFDVENSTNEDFLAIFDGSSNQAVLLNEYRSNPGRVIADNGPAPNPDGSLTLWFVSDFIFNRSGFEASISCVPRPNAVINGSQTICVGQNAELRINLTGTPPFRVVYETNGATTQVDNIQANSYTFTVSPGIGLHNYTIVSVSDANLTQLRPPLTRSSATVEVIAGPTANFVRPQYQVCQGNSVEIEVGLSGSSPFDFSISDGTTVQNINSHTENIYRFRVAPQANTTYNLLTISDSRCPSGRIVQDRTDVVVSPPPSANLTGALSTGVCPGESTSLRVEFTGSGPWELVYFDGSQNRSVQVLNTPLLIPVQPSTSQTYSLVSVSTPNCPPGQVNGTVQVNVYPQPDLSVTTAVGCDDGIGRIELTGSNGREPYEYSFDGGQTWVANRIAQRPPSPQPYLVAIRDANGCKRTAQALIQGLPAPQITNIINITQNSMTVIWSSVPGTGVYYSLRYRIAGTDMPWITIPFIPQNQRNIAGLQSGTTYEFEVKVFCSGDLSSDWSLPAEATTLEGQPADCASTPRAPWPMPGGFYYDQLTSRSVRLNWNSVAGPGYIVAWGLANINPNNWPQDVVCNQVPLTRQSHYVITGLTPGTTYRARVRTNCSNCTTALQSTDRRSAWTQIIEFTTPNLRSLEEYEQQSTIRIYPNPNSGRFQLDGLSAGATRWFLMDIHGRIIQQGLTQVVADQPVEYQFTGLSSGMYLLRLVQTKEEYRLKIWIN